MAKKNKIERGNIRSNAKKIPLASNIPSPDTLKVSFKYLDIIGNEKFSIAICPDGYLETFLDKRVVTPKNQRVQIKQIVCLAVTPDQFQ